MSPSEDHPTLPARKMAVNNRAASLAKFSPLSLARSIWKRKLLLFTVWLVATAVGAAIVLRLKPIYRAETLILVESQKIPDKYVASTVISDVQDRLATISQEILSTTRLKKIIEDYKLYSDARNKLALEEVVEIMRHDVDVKLEKGWSNNRPGAFRIAYQGSDPVVVASVVNRLAGLYIDENIKVREQQADGTSQFLDGQLKEAKRTLDELEAAVSRYKLEHNGELPQQEGAANTALTRLQTELQGAQDAMNRAQQNIILYDAELANIDSRLSALTAARDPATPAESAAPAVGAALPPEQPPTSKALAEHLRLLRTRYSDEHPEVKRIKVAIAEALKAEQQAAPSAPKTAAQPQRAPKQPALSVEAARQLDQLQQRTSALRAQRELAERDIASADARRQNILREMARYQNQLHKMPIREQEMAALTRDYETAKGNYRSLLDKKTSADLAAEMEHRQKAEKFIVLDSAQPPETPSKPNRPLLMAVASIVGLALGIGLALAKEWNANVLLGEWELPPGVRILGRIPVIPSSAAADSTGARKPRKQSKAQALAVGGSVPPALVLMAVAFMRAVL